MPADRLHRWERLGLIAVAVGLVVLGYVTVVRGAMQQLRRTDFGVYARAGWAVRTGGDLYGFADDRGWHYCYPPPFAVLMVPLADPPAGEDRAGSLPFAVSAAVWYLLGVGCVAFAAHRFAAAILPDDRRFGRRWWYARTLPVYVCFGGIGFSLARGQVNPLVLALAAGGFAAAVAGRRFGAGAWLAAAACVKIIPAFLGLFYLVRKDARGVAGMVAGAAVLLGVVPAAVWGPAAAVGLNAQVLKAVLQPGATGTGDQTRAKELTETTSTDSQSFQALIHNLRHPDPDARPAHADAGTRLAHWAVGGLLTLGLIVVAVRRRPDSPADQLVLFGLLFLLMLHLSPVSHMHYYAFGLPLACGLWLKGMADRPGAIGPDRRAVLALAGWGLLTAVPLFPGEPFDTLRASGCGVLASLALGVFAAGRLGRTPATASVEEPVAVRRAA